MQRKTVEVSDLARRPVSISFIKADRALQRLCGIQSDSLTAPPFDLRFRSIEQRLGDACTLVIGKYCHPAQVSFLFTDAVTGNRADHLTTFFSDKDRGATQPLLVSGWSECGISETFG